MKILILGGGISGLSAAWFLKKKHPKARITLLEKTDRLGGWIRTDRENGYLIERGPRTFQAGRSPHLLQLIRDLGLEAEMIGSDPAAAKRYLWHRGKLRSFSSLLPRLLPVLLREPFIPPNTKPDESIYDFAARRFSKTAADLLFDPMTLGIYAGDIRKLSLKSCFPKFDEWERQHGSLVKAMFKQKKKGKGLFTLKGGMQRLIDELEKQLEIEIGYHCEATAIRDHEIEAGGKIWTADRIVSALPAPAIGRLFNEPFVSQSLSVVHLVFPSSAFKKRGFGYLIHLWKKNPFWGWFGTLSSSPSKDERQEFARFTAMVRPEVEDPVEAALEAARLHLKIFEKPLHISLFHAKEAIPQYEVGHSERAARFEQKHPSITFLGSAFEGVSVESCIHRAFKKITIL